MFHCLQNRLLSRTELLGKHHWMQSCQTRISLEAVNRVLEIRLIRGDDSAHLRHIEVRNRASTLHESSRVCGNHLRDGPNCRIESTLSTFSRQSATGNTHCNFVTRSLQNADCRLVAQVFRRACCKVRDACVDCGLEDIGTMTDCFRGANRLVNPARGCALCGRPCN